MSAPVLVTLIITLGVIIVVGILAQASVLRHRTMVDHVLPKNARRSPQQIGGYESAAEPPAALPQVDSGPAPGSYAHVCNPEQTMREEAAIEEQGLAEVPIPVDVSKPPHWVVYQPREGRPVRTCHCHGEPLTPGQDVLWWTKPDQSVLLFCDRTVPRKDPA